MILSYRSDEDKEKEVHAIPINKPPQGEMYSQRAEKITLQTCGPTNHIMAHKDIG